ncbi:MAG TPA: hypothetical protein VEB66_14820 [Opitutaceae bacterium]|nr:hypothetical protein [Opitutaceae bacterium]
MAWRDLVRRFGWVAALGFALLVWGFEAAARGRIVESANRYGRTAAPAADPGSPTGFEFGQRTRLQLSADSYHWTMQTQEMLARGEPRVRRADYDNAPRGREVHWSSPLRWWLAGLGWLETGTSGRSTAAAVERAAGPAGPLLLVLLALALAPIVARRFGGAAGAVFAAGLFFVAPVSSAFATGAVDHHGLAVLAGLTCVLALAAVPDATPGPARRWAVASGVAGGAGLWISAATQVPVLVGIGAGALAAAWAGRKESAAFDPRLWRTWGVAGALTSLAAYGLEYFPAHLGWRLEVNHPLYAVAWAGAGELLHRAARRARGEAFLGRGREAALAVAAAAGLALLPAAILVAGARTFWVSDPLLWMIHADYIEEFRPLLDEFRRPDGLPGWVVLLLVVNVLPLLAGPALIGGLRREAPAGTRAALWLALAPALLALAMAFAQKRWLHLSGALWLGVFVVMVGAAADRRCAPARAGWRRGALWAFALLVLAPFPVAVARQWAALAREGAQVGPGEMRELAARDVARWIRRRAGNEPVVVLSDPTTTTQLVYFGGFRGVGTLYWENLEGLRAAVAAAGAESPDRAAEVLRERSVTHVVLFSWQRFGDESARLAQGLRPWEPVRRAGFLQAVQSGRLPPWLRPVAYRLPGHPYFADRYAAVFEVAFDQTAADAGVHQARYLLAHGDEAGALRLLAEVRRQEPDHIAALCTLAQLALARRDAARLDEIWPRIRTYLAQGGAVDAADRLVIVHCLLAAGRRDEARRELAEFWGRADEPTLRRLPPGALAAARRLAADLGVPRPEQTAVMADRLDDAMTSP